MTSALTQAAEALRKGQELNEVFIRGKNRDYWRQRFTEALAAIEAEQARIAARQPTDCKIDQHYPADEPCPRCGEGPCKNAGTFRVPSAGRVIRNVEDAEANLREVVAAVERGDNIDPDTLAAAEAALARQSRVPEDRERMAKLMDIEADRAQALVMLPGAVSEVAILKRQIAAALRTTSADGWREVAEATREACARQCENGTREGNSLAKIIRAMPISPPAEETKK